MLHNKQQENELRHSEERFRLMIEGAPFPIVVCGLEEYSILYCNQLAAGFFQRIARRSDAFKNYGFLCGTEGTPKIVC